MITFLTAYLLLLITGSIITLGFHTITRGEIKVLPNGNEYEEKEILGNWQLFWEEVVKYDIIFYYEDQLELKLKILEQLRPSYFNQISFSTPQRKSLYFNVIPTQSEVRDIEFTLNCHVSISEHVVFLYDRVPLYRFSEWVRKITNCYICISGWGGTCIYWTALFYFPGLYDNSTHPLSSRIVFWVLYCVSLAFVNKSVKEYLTDKKNNS